MRPHLRVIALGLVFVLALPVVIGTVVLIRRALQEDSAALRPPPQPFSTVAFRVGDNPTLRCAWLAATDAARQEGMQNKSSLRGYDAMVFSFAADTTVNFVNHFVPIDLSIAWFDAAGTLVDHTTMEQCRTGENCPTYASRDPFRYAVEAPIGGLERLGLTQPGATLHVGGSCS